MFGFSLRLCTLCNNMTDITSSGSDLRLLFIWNLGVYIQLYTIFFRRCDSASMGLLQDTQNGRLPMGRESLGRFPRHRLQRNLLVSMSRSLTRGGGENVPSIPGACAARKFMYLARDPRLSFDSRLANLPLNLRPGWCFILICYLECTNEPLCKDMGDL